jgi:hypothetical protein
LDDVTTPVLPELVNPANLTDITNDPEYRTDGILEGTPNESCIALTRACANFP